MEYAADDPASPGGVARADFSWQRVRCCRRAVPIESSQAYMATVLTALEAVNQVIGRSYVRWEVVEGTKTNCNKAEETLGQRTMPKPMLPSGSFCEHSLFLL